MNYREIVTKAVLGKSKKTFVNKYTLTTETKPSTILGCWVINHNFGGTKNGDDVLVNGSYDINIWYSYNDDKETMVAKKTMSYQELFSVTRKRESDISSNEEIIVRSLREPSCINVKIVNGNIEYEIEKSLGVEIVGDTKVRIAIDNNEDDWEDLNSIVNNDDEINKIDDEVTENFIDEK